MAARLPHDLDGFIPLLSTTDIRMKVTVGCKLFTYLEEPSNSIECSDIGMFIDGIVQWLSNSNPKVTLYGIEIITLLINRMKLDFRPYISTILPLAVDRIGDSKEPIKVKTLFLIMKLMECNTISPQVLFDKISVNAFYHKNSNVKEGSMKLLLLTIEEFGVNCISVSKIIPMIIKLLSDPNVQVRQKAFETLVDLYKHVGERLRVDIQKKYSIPQSKMTDLMNKFDEVKATGSLLATAFVGLSLTNDDETDRTCTFAAKNVIGSIKRPSSILPPKSNFTTPLRQVDFVQKPTSSSALSASRAGGVDEDTFIRAFENVPTLQIYSVRDLDDTMKKIHGSIQDSNEQWNKRVESLKKIRSLVLIGATKYEEFFNNLRYLEHSFQISIKDLRSQVIRETCITIAFLAQRLGIKFNHFSESIFGNLIDLIQNSAKVTASSGLVAIRFIIEYTHAPRIIPILANSLGSKSKDIRRACCEFFDQILRTWPTQAIERHLTILQDCIQKGIADADSNARVLSRKAYWEFCEIFPEHGEILLNNLEPAYRKILLTNSGSNLFLSKSVIAESTKLSSRRPVTTRSNISVRSRSAIDLQAAKRSNARTEYASLSRQKFNPIQSVTKKTKEDIHQTDKEGRSRVQVSLCQPASCSRSPSSKLNFVQTKSNRATSGIPRYRDTSREVSPNRLSINGMHIMNSIESPTLFTPRPIRTQKISTQSQEANSAITDALSNKNYYKFPRKVLEGLFNDYSDESETSSMGSERRVDSHKRFSDSFYLNGSVCGLHKEIWNNSSLKCLNIEDIISNRERTASPPLQPDTIDTFNLAKKHESFDQSSYKVQKCRLRCHYPEEINAASCESRINQLSIHTETNSQHLNGFNNGHTTVDGIIQILDDLDKDTLQPGHKQPILIHLKELIKDVCSADELIKNFEKIINVILKLLMDVEPIVREHTITLIIYLVKKSELATYFHNYTELIILKVINMCCDSYKPIVKVAEECLIALSVSLHHETVVKIITPLIIEKEFPVNLIAIRMMTKLIDVCGSPPVTDQIKEIMSGLLQSYDNPDSAVRKSAVYCMVSLYNAFGSQEFIPYISSLNGAKLKLLNLYIERAQQPIKIN